MKLWNQSACRMDHAVWDTWRIEGQVNKAVHVKRQPSEVN